MIIKSYDELSFIDDFLFCKILENNLDICKELLELILNIKIREIKVERQKSIDVTSDAHGIRLDVYVEDENNTVYDLEMQTTLKKDLPKRTRYYQGMLDLHLIEKGEAYKKLRKCIIIFICLDDPFDKGLHVYEFTNRCHQIPELELGDEATKIFLNAKGTADDISDGMKEFLNYLCGVISNNQLVQKIDRQVKEAREQKKWRDEYMTLALKYNEFLEEGREEGIKLGLEEGRQEGRQEGLKEGHREGQINVAKSMLLDDIPIDKILKYCPALTEANVKELQLELKKEL